MQVMNRFPKLKWCPECKECSAVVKVWSNQKRVEFCLNHGCDYVVNLGGVNNE